MHLYLRPFSSLVFLLLCAYVAWEWVTWFRVGNRVTPGWRARTVFAGLCFATLSTVLSVFLFVHATLTGGYPFYHPVELFRIRFGFLTALLGLAASIVGKGGIRPHVAAISTLNLLFWLWVAECGLLPEGLFIEFLWAEH
jgi:hypothetical protein